MKRAWRQVSALLVCAAVMHAAAAAPSGVPARFERVADGSMVLDGRLDEAAWARAPVLQGFFEIYPRALVRSRAATQARFLFDGRALYIGVHMDEPDPRSLRAPYVERDQVNDDEDYIQVYIDGDGS